MLRIRAPVAVRQPGPRARDLTGSDRRFAHRPPARPDVSARASHTPSPGPPKCQSRPSTVGNAVHSRGVRSSDLPPLRGGGRRNLPELRRVTRLAPRPSGGKPLPAIDARPANISVTSRANLQLGRRLGGEPEGPGQESGSLPIGFFREVFAGGRGRSSGRPGGRTGRRGASACPVQEMIDPSIFDLGRTPVIEGGDQS